MGKYGLTWYIHLYSTARCMKTWRGFDWDEGNRAKCQKHGVSVTEVEGLFSRPLLIIPDALHSKNEERLWRIGKTARGRSVFLVFTIRAWWQTVDPPGQRTLHAQKGSETL